MHPLNLTALPPEHHIETSKHWYKQKKTRSTHIPCKSTRAKTINRRKSGVYSSTYLANVKERQQYKAASRCFPTSIRYKFWRENLLRQFCNLSLKPVIYSTLLFPPLSDREAAHLYPLSPLRLYLSQICVLLGVFVHLCICVIVESICTVQLKEFTAVRCVVQCNLFSSGCFFFFASRSR